MIDRRDGVGARAAPARCPAGTTSPTRSPRSPARPRPACRSARRSRALGSFAGLARRFDVIGTSPSGITVIDDFGHNPEKCRATLRTLKAHPGPRDRVLPAARLRPAAADGRTSWRRPSPRELGPDDVTILCDPVYFGGTVDRSRRQRADRRG